jgi:hypothetical protein
MPLLVPHEGELVLMSDMIGGGTLENWQLCLYNSNIIPNESDVAANYTSHETTFSGYARVTLTRSISPTTWNTPVSQAPSGSPAWSSRSLVGHTQYGSSPQTWTCGVTGDTVYGYFIIGVSSGKLICAEAFVTPRTLASGDVISIQPVFENA